MNEVQRRLMPAAALFMALSASVTARAEVPKIDFDKGVDVSAVLQSVKQSAKKEGKVIPASVKAYFRRYDRDCVSFTFRPNDPPQSEAVWLHSREWVEECRHIPGPPGQGGYRDCHERPGFSYRERVQITLRDRLPLLPWEYDRFSVCLEGPWLDVFDKEAAYDYKMVQGGDRDGNIVLAPIKKIAMRPDPAGITPASWTANLRLSLADRWASYYAGELTVLEVKLRKHVTFWPDVTLLEKTLTVTPSSSYEVDFPSFAGEFSQKLEQGKEYYVEYRFKRQGAVSKPDWTKSSETGKVNYQPASLALGL